MESLRTPVSPFIPAAMDWFDLDDESRQVLFEIAKQPSLKQLISARDDKHPLRIWQYNQFIREGMIERPALSGFTITGEIHLTTRARGWVKRYATAQRFEAGDLVTITSMEHVIHYRSGQGRAFWRARTDGEYVLNVFIEDFKALAKAGYTVPDFNASGKVKVSIDVLVSKEIQSSGWRIAEIRPKV